MCSTFSCSLMHRFPRRLCWGCPYPAGAPREDAFSGAKPAWPLGWHGLWAWALPAASRDLRVTAKQGYCGAFSSSPPPSRFPGGSSQRAPSALTPTAHAAPTPGSWCPVPGSLTGQRASPPVDTCPHASSPSIYPCGLWAALPCLLHTPPRHLQDTSCAQDVSPWPLTYRCPPGCVVALPMVDFRPWGPLTSPGHRHSLALSQRFPSVPLLRKSPRSRRWFSHTWCSVVRLGFVLVFHEGGSTLTFLQAGLRRGHVSSRLGFLQ